MATNGSKNGTVVTLEWLPAASDATLVSDLTYTVVAFPSVVSLTSMLTTSNTSIQLFILYNQEYNITVVASNCVGNSTPAKTTLTVGNYTNLVDLAIVNKFLVTRMRLSLYDHLLLGYCARPITGPNVAIMENSISGLEGSMITYYCQWMPNEHMVATCLSNGSWSPDPRDMECPSHTITHYYNTTTTTTTTVYSETEQGN